MSIDDRGWLAGPALLFCPGDRPERFHKAALAADMVILDLEDGVGTAGTSRARAAVRESQLDPARTIVRVHQPGSSELDQDLQMLDQTDYRTVMVPEMESAAELNGFGGRVVVALCETPLGILNSATIAACESVSALMWGAEDLTAALGGSSSRLTDGRYTDVVRSARSQVLLAAGAHGKSAIDAVYVNLDDLAGLEREAEDAAVSGFAGKACVHPRQAQVVRNSFIPPAQTVEWAKQVLSLAGESQGAFSFNGQMIDRPLLRQAKRVMNRAQTQARQIVSKP